MNEIDKLEKKEFGSKSIKDYEDRFQPFLMVSLLFLIIEFFISNRKSGKLDGINLFEVQQ